MTPQVLYDKQGRIIGRIDQALSRLRISNELGRVLGTYEPSSNKTYDALGRYVGSGNLLTMLLNR